MKFHPCIWSCVGPFFIPELLSTATCEQAINIKIWVCMEGHAWTDFFIIREKLEIRPSPFHDGEGLIHTR